MWVKALFPVSMIVAILANLVGYLILAETNKHKPDGKKDPYFWWDLRKGLRIFNEYEQEYPDGRKASWFKICCLVATLTFVAWFFLSTYFTSLA